MVFGERTLLGFRDYTNGDNYDHLRTCARRPTDRPTTNGDHHHDDNRSQVVRLCAGRPWRDSERAAYAKCPAFAQQRPAGCVRPCTVRPWLVVSDVGGKKGLLGTTNARRDGSGGGATERERDGPRAATAGERTAHTRSSQAPRTMSRPLSSWPVSAVPPARVADRTGTCPRRSCWLAFGLVHERSGPPRSTSLRRAAKRIGAPSPHVHGRVGRSIGARSRGLGGRCSRWSAVVSTAVRLVSASHAPRSVTGPQWSQLSRKGDLGSQCERFWANHGAHCFGAPGHDAFSGPKN